MKTPVKHWYVRRVRGRVALGQGGGGGGRSAPRKRTKEFIVQVQNKTRAVKLHRTQPLQLVSILSYAAVLLTCAAFLGEGVGENECNSNSKAAGSTRAERVKVQ